MAPLLRTTLLNDTVDDLDDLDVLDDRYDLDDSKLPDDRPWYFIIWT